MPRIANRTFGLGAGITIDTTGTNVRIPMPVAGFYLKNADNSTDPIYVLANFNLTGGADWPTTTAAIPNVRTQAGIDDNLEALTAAQALERGIRLDPGSDIVLRAYGSYDGSPQITQLCILTASGTATVYGGTNDISGG